MTRNDKEAFRATLAPGVNPPNFDMDVDINNFHCSFDHVHEGLLRETAKQQHINLTGTLRECQGCSIAKGRAKTISTTTRTRAVKPGGRIFLHVCWEKSVQSIEGKKYMVMIRNDLTSLGSMLSISCAAKTRFPEASDTTSQTSVLLVYHAPQEQYALTTLQSLRVRRLLIFTGSGVSGKNSPLQTVRSLSV